MKLDKMGRGNAAAVIFVLCLLALGTMVLIVG